MIQLILIPLLIAVVSSLVMTKISVLQTRRRLTEKSRPLTHPAITLQAERLARALDLDHVRVLELDDPAINGFADPDGRIFLTRGFIAQFGQGRVSAEELAAVIAHELGHVAQGHTKQRMRDVTGHQAAQMMAGMVLARFIPFVGPWIAAQATGAIMAKLSRGHEFEADEWATALLIKAGIGSQPQKSLFLKLDGLTGQRGDIPAWLRSHPTSAERIAMIEKNEALWQLPRS